MLKNLELCLYKVLNSSYTVAITKESYYARNLDRIN
jgi:hypothetical protein